MTEIKDETQVNIRGPAEIIRAFKKLCDENGYTYSQAIEKMLASFALTQAKENNPGRAVEIEHFQALLNGLMESFKHSFEIYDSLEERLKKQYASDLDSKDKTIANLQSIIDQLKADKAAAEATAAEAMEEKDQAEKTAEAAEKFRTSAEQTAKDKTTIADTLATKLAETEKKAEGYDDLKAALSISQDAQKAAEQHIKDIKKDTEHQIKDIQREAAEAAKDAAREAERLKDQAVKEISDTLQEQISVLQE